MHKCPPEVVGCSSCKHFDFCFGEEKPQKSWQEIELKAWADFDDKNLEAFDNASVGCGDPDH